MNFSYLYFVIENSSTITSLALIYKKVPAEIAKSIPSTSSVLNKIIPIKIPIGEKIENISIILITFSFSVADLKNEIP